MKQIYLFNEGSRAANYGVGTYINQLKNCFLGADDIFLNIVNVNSEKEEFQVEHNEKCRNFYFPSGYLFFDEPTVLIYMRNVWSLLLPYIQAHESGEIYFHFNFFQESPLVDLAKQDFPNCKTILTIHYMNWCFLLKGNTSYFKKIVTNGLLDSMSKNEKDAYSLYESEKQMMESVDHIICLANYTKELLVNVFKILANKLSLIYNGLDDQHIRILQQEEKQLVKESLYIPENEKIILFAGRLDAIKGVELLIRAFKQVVEEYSKVRLIIVGDGDYQTYLNEAKGLWNKIIFTGKLNKSEVYQFYQIADLGVIPSMHEQCSYVGIEMMAFGLPIIGTTSTGLNEMLPKKDGFFKIQLNENGAEVNAPLESLAQYMLTILRSDKNYLTGNRNYFQAHYQKSIFCKNMIEFYNTIS